MIKELRSFGKGKHFVSIFSGLNISCAARKGGLTSPHGFAVKFRFPVFTLFGR